MAIPLRCSSAIAPTRTHVLLLRPRVRARVPAYRHRNALVGTPARFQSTASGSETASSSGAVMGGLIGGLVALTGGYAWYHFSGAKSVVSTAQSAQAKFDQAFNKAAEKVPEPNEAIKWLRETTTSYAAFVPGAKAYVDSVFDGIEEAQKKHGGEVDKIVKDAYDELKQVGKDAQKQGGPGLDSVSKAWDVLQKAMKRIGELAGDAADDLLSKFPEVRDKVGGSLDQLKNMGEQYGPDAKKKADETWSQVQDILKGGIGVGTVDKIRKLVQEKMEELKSAGDEAWSKGMEKAKPLMDKNPKIKEMVEKNKEKLMQGDLGKLWDKVTKAAKSGDTKDVESFVKEEVDKVSKKAGGDSSSGDDSKGGSGGGGDASGLEQYLRMIPGGEEVAPKLAEFQELVQKHGDEAEKLAKDAFKEISDVLSRKVDEARKLADNAKSDAKKKASK